jgi:hypothetical protein
MADGSYVTLTGVTALSLTGASFITSPPAAPTSAAMPLAADKAQPLSGLADSDGPARAPHGWTDQAGLVGLKAGLMEELNHHGDWFIS